MSTKATRVNKRNKSQNTKYCTVEPPYSGHHWDQVNCPDYRCSPQFMGEFVL